MSSHRHSRGSKRDSSRKILAFVTKQVTSMIPTIMSQIQASNTANGSNDTAHTNNQPKGNFDFKKFSACNPEPFTGEDGAAKMLSWFDSIEVSFINSECPENLKTRSATGVFRGKANEWWATERNHRGNEVAYALPWEEVKKLMVVEFCPPHEMQKLEDEFWNLKQVSGDNKTYTTRHKQLSILVPHLVSTPERAISKYLRGLPPAVRDAVTSSSPATIVKAYTMAATLTNNLVEDGTLSIKGSTKAANQVIVEQPTDTTMATIEPKPKPKTQGRKRKLQARNYAVAQNPIPNAIQNPPNPIPNIIQNPNPIRKAYTGSLPKCNTCQFHHLPFAPCRHCTICNRFGHVTTTCQYGPRPQFQQPQIQNPQPPVNNARVCYRCGDPNHLSPQCPQRNDQAPPQQPRGRAFVIQAAQTQDDNDVVDD